MSAHAAPEDGTARGLRVLVADEDQRALDVLATVLGELGHEVVPYAISVSEAIELIASEDPDLAIVMVHRDQHHALALIAEAVEYASGPVIAQLAESDIDFITLAAERGISAYVDSIAPGPLQAAIEVALRRYRDAAELDVKVEQLEGALARRGTIERAKGILMERHGLDERAAFELIRDHARSESRRAVDVAQAVTDGFALDPKR